MNHDTVSSITSGYRKFYTAICFLVFIYAGLFYSCNHSMHTKDGSGDMVARIDAKTGQAFIMDKDKPVLRYIYATVYEDDEFAFNGLDANEYVATVLDTFMANPSIYAVPRSNYIHPVFGLNGEILTRDWAKDHPHHRGIYWAWPEVDYGSERGDLHALQKVFARPTGRIRVDQGNGFARIEAENVWITEKGLNTIVREISLIQAYNTSEHGRIIDLAFFFEGIKDSVTIARRGTEHYGGLNIRMMSPKGQEINYHNDEEGQIPRRSWSDLSGVFAGNQDPSGMTVLQHSQNPQYPGDWVEYPDLSWVQPTFPDAGYRYALKPGEPLILRFRILVHTGMKPDAGVLDKLWDDFNSEKNPAPEFTLQ